MKNVCWSLILLAALAFVLGTYGAFTKTVIILEPVGFWRGAVGFLLFALALRSMDEKK